MKILVGTDFSTRSDRAIRRATLLARKLGADLTILHAVDDDRPRRIVASEREAAAALLDEQARSLHEVDGVECTSRIVLGRPFESIVKATEDPVFDLLVIGPHRGAALKDIFVGTTAERTIRASRLPVLMTNGVPAGFYRHILVAVDLSECSGDAVRAVVALGLAKHAAVSVVHVFDAPGTALLKRAMMDEDEVRDYVATEEARAAGELAAFLSGLEISPARRILKLDENATAAAICTAAREIGADLIVAGTRGRTGMTKLLLGSVAEELLRISDCDVLAVPPRHRN